MRRPKLLDGEKWWRSRMSDLLAVEWEEERNYSGEFKGLKNEGEKLADMQTLRRRWIDIS
jgi:hypothetical protein